MFGLEASVSKNPNSSMSQEDLRLPLLASPNTNWIVKTEKLLFDSVLINSGLQPVEHHSLLKKQHVCYSLTKHCVLRQSVDLGAVVSVHLNAVASSFHLTCIYTLRMARWCVDKRCSLAERLLVTVLYQPYSQCWELRSCSPLVVFVFLCMCAFARL